MSKRRILFYTEAWGVGGIESFVMNTVETLDLSKYSFDIFSTHDWNKSYDKRLEELGSMRKVIFPDIKPNIIKRTICGALSWNKLITNSHYDVVHINTMNGMGFLYSMIAKYHKVPVRIVHSHNSSFSSRGFLIRTVKNIAHSMGCLFMGRSATHRIACSQAAGEYLFPGKSFEILQNGINTLSFKFDNHRRNIIRKQLDIPQNALVFGSVGRLTEVKNPFFQIRLLAKLLKRNANTYALLVGEGNLKEELVSYARSQGVERFLRLPGTTQSPANYLSALDVFTMPSFFEGSPFAAIEAFANGLPVVLSNKVPNLLKNSSRETHLPLDDLDTWTRSVQEQGINQNHVDREIYCADARIRGFDRHETTLKLEKIYG